MKASDEHPFDYPAGQSIGRERDGGVDNLRGGVGEAQELAVMARQKRQQGLSGDPAFRPVEPQVELPVVAMDR